MKNQDMVGRLTLVERSRAEAPPQRPPDHRVMGDEHLLEDDMDLRAAAGRDVLDKQAAIELCDLALSKVDAELAEIFVLFELDGLSSPEIAALLEIPLGTVASRLRRAREQFRAVVARLEIAMRREGHA